MLKITNLNKNFEVHQKEPGLRGSIKSLFSRTKVIKKALSEINLEIKKGEIIGLMGANGAGKTTLIKILSGIIYPTSGEVSIYGYRPWERKNELRRKMSLIMGQKSQVWWDLPALDSFSLLKEIYQVENQTFKENLDYLSSELNIKDQLKIQVRKLSLGERMKVELMAALLHRPQVIFLDEPTIGLDFSSQKAVRKFIKNYQKEFRPITILTSHYMDDIKELCSRIAIMRKGEIIYDGQLRTIQKMMGNEKSISVTTQEKEFNLKVEKKNLAKVMAQLCQDHEVQDLNIHDPSIEEIITSIIERGLS